MNKANSSNTEAPCLDLDLSITNGIVSTKRGSYMVWEINKGVCFINGSLFIDCLGYDFYIYGALSFYAISLFIYDVMYYITTIP